jgi:hypothetical protein
MANSYVTEAAQALQPIVRRIVAKNGAISANDIRQHEDFDGIMADTGLVQTEISATILRAFRLAGLRTTGQRVANRTGSARYRKVSVWAAAA